MASRKRVKSESDDDYVEGRRLRKKPSAKHASAKDEESILFAKGLERKPQEEPDLQILGETLTKPQLFSKALTAAKPRNDDAVDYPLLSMPKSGSRFEKADKCFGNTMKSLAGPDSSDSEKAEAYLRCLELAKYLHKEFVYQGECSTKASKGRTAAKDKLVKVKKEDETKLSKVAKENEELKTSNADLKSQIIDISILRKSDKDVLNAKLTDALQQNQKKDEEILRLQTATQQEQGSRNTKYEDDSKQARTTYKDSFTKMEIDISIEEARKAEKVKQLEAQLQESRQMISQVEREKAEAEEKVKDLKMYKDRVDQILRMTRMPMGETEQ